EALGLGLPRPAHELMEDADLELALHAHHTVPAFPLPLVPFILCMRVNLHGKEGAHGRGGRFRYRAERGDRPCNRRRRALLAAAYAEHCDTALPGCARRALRGALGRRRTVAAALGLRAATQPG